MSSVPAGMGMDRTGGAQSWVHSSFPGARYVEHGVHYVTVIGNAVRGRQSYAHDAYKQVLLVPVENTIHFEGVS
jgi:hypothetical protein